MTTKLASWPLSDYHEALLLVSLDVIHTDPTEVPGGVVCPARVVMPYMERLHLSQGLTGAQQVMVHTATSQRLEVEMFCLYDYENSPFPNRITINQLLSGKNYNCEWISSHWREIIIIIRRYNNLIHAKDVGRHWFKIHFFISGTHSLPS